MTYSNNIKVFLEQISAKYAKIRVLIDRYQSELEQTIKSKQFNYVKDKVRELSLNAKNATNCDETNNIFGQTNAKFYTIAWVINYNGWVRDGITFVV